MVVWKLRYFAWSLEEPVLPREELAANGVRRVSLNEKLPEDWDTHEQLPTAAAQTKHEARRKQDLFFTPGQSVLNQLRPCATLYGYLQWTDHDAENQDWTEAGHQG